MAPSKLEEPERTLSNTPAGQSAFSDLAGPANVDELVAEIGDEARRAAAERVKAYRPSRRNLCDFRGLPCDPSPGVLELALMPSQTINVLVERDGDWWVAQCLQINLATQARTLRELLIEVQRILEAHFESCAELGTDPFAMPAPRRYWERYEQADVATSLLSLPGARAAYVAASPRVETRISA